MQPPEQPPKAARGLGSLITNLARLASVAIAVNESLLRTELRPIALAVAALFFAGAQGLETFLDRLLGK